MHERALPRSVRGPVLRCALARFAASFLAETLFELGQSSAAMGSSASIVEVDVEAEVDAAVDLGVVFSVRMANPSGLGGPKKTDSITNKWTPGSLTHVEMICNEIIQKHCLGRMLDH
jgi:hypothetical protein